MNQRSLLVVFVLFIALQSSAQDIKVGVKGDLTYSRISGDGMGVGYQAGLNAGVFGELALKNKWGIQAELLFAQRNIRIGNIKEFFASSAAQDPGKYAYLSYVTLPIAAKYAVKKNLNVTAGVQYSYLVHADETLLRDKSDGFKKNDFGLLAGLEYAPSSRLRFYGKYYRSVYDINNINNLHTWYMTQFQVGAGYVLFRTKK